ncbi:DUF4157 domain-containing protein [Bradyrhizobium liaoningense]|uniref:eCIS core domain-containing protein n=1 Tax=Bradyrhizobium liaoningense TaxID=43992 RepID=UPI001BA4E3AE|nr:DUF4157 domain-containing protein [Bradyrhizobium liaoningense]MBR0713548.1 DUF4157 domain-containing protein [Bradyrhizobium liaoningense]
MIRAVAAKAAPAACPVARSSSSRLLQRRCACADHDGAQCEECSGTKLQRKAAGGLGPPRAPAIVDEVLRRPGTPLDQDARAFMEHRFAHSFADVRVHTGSDATRSARAVNAHAYTVGRDIVFAGGHYAPDTAQGRRLLAHELTHVVQQRGAPAASAGGGLQIDPSHSADEVEAEQIGAAVAADHSLATSVGPDRPRLQRPAQIVSRLNTGAPDAVPLAMNLGQTARSGIQFVPTDVQDTVVGPVGVRGGLLDGGMSRLSVIIGENMTLHLLSLELLPLWTTATPFTPPGAAAPLPLDIVTADQLAQALLVYNQTYLEVPPAQQPPAMQKWRAGLRLPLPVEIDEATHVATVNPQTIIALAGAFDPAMAPVLQQRATATVAPSAAQIAVEVATFLRDPQFADATSRGITLGARALTSATAELPFIREVFRQLSAADALGIAIAFLENFVQREWVLLASQRDGSAILRLFQASLNAAAPPLNATQQSRLAVMSAAIASTVAVAPPDATRSRTEKTVTIDTVKLDGSNRDPAADIATANGIFASCNVRFVPGVQQPATPADTTAWIGADRILQEGTCGAPSVEERRLINGAMTTFGLSARIRTFYVPTLSTHNRADSCPPGISTALASRAAYVSNDAMGRSLAHEMGHILLDSGAHRKAVTNIMTSTNEAPLGETIDDGQCNTIYRNA